MQHDVDWLTPAGDMPWPVVTPFRMRPNLEKLDPDAPALLLKDALADVYRRERERVIAAYGERSMVGIPNRETLAAISGLTTFLQEDFVILKLDGDTLRTEYLCVCFPSRWDPREKLGLDFAAIHAPVADNAALIAASQSIVTMAFMKQPMLRHVWLIVPSASLDQHPDKNGAWWTETLRDMSPLLPNLFFRVERQTTWPLPHLQRAVFFIRVMMSPLVDVIQVAPGRAALLAASLRSMTPEVVAYRGMTDAMPRLLAELDHFE